MRLDHYLDYCRQQHDEEPLYLFDASFGEAAPELLGQYSVPPLFRHDLLAALGSAKREDYRHASCRCCLPAWMLWWRWWWWWGGGGAVEHPWTHLTPSSGA